MKLEFRRDPEAEETLVTVVAREMTPEVEALLKRLRVPEKLPAYGERGEALLEPGEIIRVYTEKRRVLAQSEGGSFLLRMRLYEAEERLGGDFVRISHGELVNRAYIRSLDFSLTGTIKLSLRGGVETYVSRRYVARIRRIFGG